MFEISYKSPDDEAGNFEPRHLVEPIQRHHHIHEQSDSMDDDQQKLLDIEQNIANLEKNLIRGKCLLISSIVFEYYSQANICQFYFEGFLGILLNLFIL